MKEMNRIHLSAWKSACAVFLFCAVATIGSSAQTFKTLVNFNGSNGTGASAPIQAFDGNYYGTVGGGGANCPQGAFCGSIYRLSAGKMTKIYRFCQQTGCPDGENPGGLVQGMDGNLYGETFGGGANGGGTFFRITLSGKLTTISSFCAPSVCGYNTFPSLSVQGPDGSFYGVAEFGGANGYGSITKMSLSGKVTVLHNFNLNDGGAPDGLIQGADGNLYGTTYDGGNLNCLYYFQNFWGGCGTVFELTTKGRFSSLYSFCPFSCADGALPQGRMVEDASGNFYGTTTFGGFGYAESQCDTIGCGTIFKLSAQGQLTSFYTFCTQNAGECTDGFWPAGGLTLGSDGNLYGSAPEGGLWLNNNCSYACGTLFSVTPGGTFSVLHAFVYTDGADPSAAPTQTTDGIFLGESGQGGSGNYGTLFSLSMNLPAFVETNPSSGKVGTTVVIMGNNLKGSTAVTFNGTAAQFRVAANSAIVATVPTGATSGLVSVTIPSGTLTSNVAFTVRP